MMTDQTWAEFAYWIAFTAAAAIVFPLFRDLARLKRWVRWIERANVMWRFRDLYAFLVTFGVLWPAAALPHIQSGARFWTVSSLARLGVFAGVINPSLMTREQSRDALNVPISEPKPRLDPDTSLIVAEEDEFAQGHSDVHCFVCVSSASSAAQPIGVL